MANGAEALLKTLFKAMGFDPVEMASGLQGFIQHVYTKLDEFDQRMTAQEELMQKIVEMLKDKGNAPNNLVYIDTRDERGIGVVGYVNDTQSSDSSDRATGTTGG